MITLGRILDSCDKESKCNCCSSGLINLKKALENMNTYEEMIKHLRVLESNKELNV